MRYLSVAVGLVALFSDVWSAAIPSKRAKVCNGHAELCDRSYGNTTFLASHDSFAFSEDPLALARTQAVDIPTQLKLGARMLQAQAHLDNNQLRFCHTSCLLFDGGTVEDYLKNVKTFLDANPDEVLTLLFTNPDGASLPDQWKPAFDNSGISDLAFVPPSLPVKQSDWPTLGQMIDSGKRVVVFLDAGADGSDGGQVPFILPEFDMIWEPPFSSTDPNFPCKVDRISGPLSPQDHMYMINHNLNKKIIGDILVPDPIDAAKTNGLPSILANSNGCAPLAGGRAPSFLLMDFMNQGDGVKAADLLNGLS